MPSHRVVDDTGEQIDGAMILDDPVQQSFQGDMIDTLEIFPDIAFEEKWGSGRKVLRPLHRCMGSLACAAGVGVVDQPFFKERLQDVDDGMMRHPVAKVGGGDLAALGVRTSKIQ